jgi:hypothetical protein
MEEERRKGRSGGRGRGAVAEEDTMLGGRGENKWVGIEKKRRKSLMNDKLAPHVRGDIGSEIFSFC